MRINSTTHTFVNSKSKRDENTKGKNEQCPNAEWAGAFIFGIL